MCLQSDGVRPADGSRQYSTQRSQGWAVQAITYTGGGRVRG